MRMCKYKWLTKAVIDLGIVVILIVLCRLFWLQPFRNAGGSMEPTLKVGDVFIVNKLSYCYKKPKRGDVVFIDTTGFSVSHPIGSPRWVKRIVGCPGDRIRIL